MSGQISYVEAFERRMNLLDLSQNNYLAFLKKWKPQLSVGVKDFISQLQADSKVVVLISGGIYEVFLFDFPTI